MAHRTRPPHTRGLLGCVTGLLAGLAPFAAQAQPVPADDRTAPALDIERPEYTPRKIHLEAITITPRLDFDTVYDNNVYASPEDRRGDAVFSLHPSIVAEENEGRLRWRAEAFALTRRYASNSRENSDSYGAAVNSTARLGRVVTLGVNAGYQRAVENRSEPEVRQNPQLGPPLFDVLSGELTAAAAFGRFGLSARGQVERYDFVHAANDDRDFTSYRGTLRLLYQLSGIISAFGQGYVNQRRFRLRAPVNGLNRDSRTLGALGGLRIDPGGKLRGEIGAGMFRFNPESAALPSFNGFALEGSVTYLPRRRTAVIVDLFNGDVATVRSGATGRVDRRARLTVQQEIRHNLLASAGLRHRQTRYRGLDTRLTTTGADAELEFLLNRNMSVAAVGQVSRRTGGDPGERFERARVGAEIRYRF